MAIIFDIDFSELSEEEFLVVIHEKIRSRQPCYIVTPNVHFARISATNENFRSALESAELRLCDSALLFRLLALKGTPLPARLTGSDLTPRLLELAEKEGLRIYLFGSDQPTLNRVRLRFPKAVCGMSCPPIHERPWELDDLNDNFLRDIRASKPDILFIALGVRKQEYWARKYFMQSAVPVTICIGASLDFLGGRIWRSPKMISKLGFEWLWRLALEPHRLLRRYSGDVLFIIERGLGELLRNRASVFSSKEIGEDSVSSKDSGC